MPDNQCVKIVTKNSKFKEAQNTSKQLKEFVKKERKLLFLKNF